MKITVKPELESIAKAMADALNGQVSIDENVRATFLQVDRKIDKKVEELKSEIKEIRKDVNAYNKVKVPNTVGCRVMDKDEWHNFVYTKVSGIPNMEAINKLVEKIEKEHKEKEEKAKWKKITRVSIVFGIIVYITSIVAFFIHTFGS